MQNLLEKQLTYSAIVGYYRNNESKKQEIGLEYERVSLNSKTFKQADFNSLFKIIEDFSKTCGFELVYDDKTIIGAKNSDGTSISLEPGGQFEVSLAPKKGLFEIQLIMQNYINKLDELGKKYNTKFFAIGNNPKTCCSEMEILNKRRYKIMAEYLVQKGKFAPVMMRETAGVQVNIDYENEFDAGRKFRCAAFMSPFLTGFFANSPFRGNKLTNYKSVRALAWKYTGADRCNLFYKDIIDKNNTSFYSEYIDNILKVPMIFIVRDGKYIKLNGKITFGEFLKNGYLGYNARMEDYITHQSLCFPDVRLKNCIEIRNHDSQNLEVAVGLGGIYKGILYSNKALDEILDFLSPLNSDDLEKIGFSALKFGVDYRVEKLKMKGYEVVKKILYLAQYNLDLDEQKYLDFLIDLCSSKRCVADLILENIKNNS